MYNVFSVHKDTPQLLMDGVKGLLIVIRSIDLIGSYICSSIKIEIKVAMYVYYSKIK